jgi:hypothetical protein
MPKELAAVEDVTPPNVSQTVHAHEVDVGIPAREQGDVGLEAAQRFT